jgi:hypothetical protein
MHLDDSFAEVAVVLNDHEHSFLPNELLDDGVDELLHLVGLLHRGEGSSVELLAHQYVAELLLRHLL